jgi:PadR family transcriptional regulator PadR
LSARESAPYHARARSHYSFATGKELTNSICCFPKGTDILFLWETKRSGRVKEKTDVPQGTLALMVLKTLDVLGPLHGYGIARRIEQISGDLLSVNQGTLYPLLLKLEQEGAIASERGPSENNRKARFYRLTPAGRKQLRAETRGWEQTTAMISRFFEVKAEDLP